jgi:putative heme degradation protein
MEKTCDGCGQPFTPARSDARFCSGRCRTVAYRVRRDGPKPAVRRKPLTDQVGRAALDLAKIVRRWKRLAEDDRFRRTMQREPLRREEFLRAVDELRRIAEAVEPSQSKAV